MTYRVIQWATGNVGRAAIEGVLAHPDLELVGAYVYSPAKAGLDVGEICGRRPVGVAATDDRDAILALDADCVVYSPMLADQDDVVAILGVGQEPGHPGGLGVSVQEPRRGGGRGGLSSRRREPARLGHQPGRHHRADPAAALGLLPRHPPRPGRGVLRHPHLRHRLRGARRDAVRPDPGVGGVEPHARAAGRRLLPVHRHGGRRPGRDPRRRQAHHPRDGGHHRSRWTRRSAPSRRAPWPPSASPGRDWSAARCS